MKPLTQDEINRAAICLIAAKDRTESEEWSVLEFIVKDAYKVATYARVGKEGLSVQDFRILSATSGFSAHTPIERFISSRHEFEERLQRAMPGSYQTGVLHPSGRGGRYIDLSFILKSGPKRRKLIVSVIVESLCSHGSAVHLFREITGKDMRVVATEYITKLVGNLRQSHLQMIQKVDTIWFEERGIAWSAVENLKYAGDWSLLLESIETYNVSFIPRVGWSSKPAARILWPYPVQDLFNGRRGFWLEYHSPLDGGDYALIDFCLRSTVKIQG